MAGSQNTDRLYFAPTMTSRDPVWTNFGADKFPDDIKYVNGLTFQYPGEPLYLSSRPGIYQPEDGTGFLSSSATEGRGVGYWSATGYNYFVLDSKVQAGATVLSSALTTSTGYVQFVPALSNGGLLLFHDGEKLYSIDTTNKVTCINADAWQASTAYTAGQFVTNDTDKVYKCTTGGTSAGSGGPTGTGSSIADGTCVWDYINTVTGGSNLPEAMVPGLVVLDQYVFVADSSGNIYNSNEGDVFTWTAGDQINSELLPDKLAGISRHMNYLIALGEQGTEIFYNAANPNGSPLSRLDGTFSYIGCFNGNTIVNMDNETVWVSQNQIGVVDVTIMKGLEMERVATPSIAASLNQKGSQQLLEAYYYSIWGRRLYVLNIIRGTSPASLKRDGNCYVLDVDSKIWYLWDYQNGAATYATTCWPFRGSAGVSVSSATAKKNFVLIERINTGSNASDAARTTIQQRFLREDSVCDYDYVEGVLTQLPLSYEVQTAMWDANNAGTKYMHRVDLLADKSKGSATATIKWQDEDESTTSGPTYSTSRTIDLNTSVAKKIYRLGSCTRRRFNVKIQSNDATYPPPRSQGLDIFYTQGAHGNS